MYWFMTKNVQIIFYLPLIYISMQNNQDKWPSYSWDIADLKILAERYFDHVQLKPYHLIFGIFESIYASKNKVDCWYSWFKHSAIWLVESYFHLPKLKNFKSTFIFLRSFSTCKKSRWLTPLFLGYSWFKNLKIWLAVLNSLQTQRAWD